MPLPPDFPFTRSSLVDLTWLLPISRFRFHAVCLLCSSFASGSSAAPDSSQIYSPLPLVSGVQSQTSWLRFHMLSSTIQAGVCVQHLWGCYGHTGYTNMGSTIHFRGPRSALVESRGQDWPCYSTGCDELTRSINFDSYCSLFPCQVQVCYCLFFLFHIVLVPFLRALFYNALRHILVESSFLWTGLLSFTFLWKGLCLCWPLSVEVFDVDASWCSSWLLGVTQPCHSSVQLVLFTDLCLFIPDPIGT